MGIPTGCCAALTRDFKNDLLSIIAGLPSASGRVGGTLLNPRASFAAVYGQAVPSSSSAPPSTVASSSTFFSNTASLAPEASVDDPVDSTRTARLARSGARPVSLRAGPLLSPRATPASLTRGVTTTAHARVAMVLPVVTLFRSADQSLSTVRGFPSRQLLERLFYPNNPRVPAVFNARHASLSPTFRLDCASRSTLGDVSYRVSNASDSSGSSSSSSTRCAGARQRHIFAVESKDKILLSAYCGHFSGI